MINASTIIIFLQPTHLGESYKSIRFSGFFLVCVTTKTTALRQISKYSNSCFGELYLLSFRLKFLVKQPFNCYFDNNLLRIFFVSFYVCVASNIATQTPCLVEDFPRMQKIVATLSASVCHLISTWYHWNCTRIQTPSWLNQLNS